MRGRVYVQLSGRALATGVPDRHCRLYADYGGPPLLSWKDQRFDSFFNRARLQISRHGSDVKTGGIVRGYSPDASERRMFGGSGFPFTGPQRDGAREPSYSRESFPGAVAGLDRLLCIGWNERYDESVIDLIASTIREAAGS